MIDYIVRFFNGDWFDIAGKVIAILFVTLLLYVCFNYARRRRLVRVIVIDCLLVAVSFVLCVLQVDNFQFFVYLTISLIALINVLFFSDDFKHDLFKGAVETLGKKRFSFQGCAEQRSVAQRSRRNSKGLPAYE